MTKFSVLMSVYRNEDAHYLNEAIESITIYQSIAPSEIILVKDGTLTEDLDNIISLHESKLQYLKVFGYDENRGLGYALNFGLELCSNELVFRMDSDDIAFHNRFETQLKYIYESDNLAIVGTNIEEFLNTPRDLNQFRIVPSEPVEIHLYKNKRNPFNHMSVLFKKSIIEQVGGYQNLPGYEDYYLWIRVLNKYDGKNLDIPLVYARIGNNLMKRRQGYLFFTKELKFQNQIFKENYITFVEYLRNILFRCIPRLLPATLLKIFYSKLLRK